MPHPREAPHSGHHNSGAFGVTVPRMFSRIRQTLRWRSTAPCEYLLASGFFLGRLVRCREARQEDGPVLQQPLDNWLCFLRGWAIFWYFENIIWEKQVPKGYLCKSLNLQNLFQNAIFFFFPFCFNIFKIEEHLKSMASYSCHWWGGRLGAVTPTWS